jgi:threonine/homoserine/homoserine lactone efflux protein
MTMELSVSGLLSLLISAAALMASPGPATLSVAATAGAYGFRGALAYVLGINLGTIAVLLAVALGASALLHAIPQLVMPVTVAASLYILYLAFRIATAPPLSYKHGMAAPGLFPGLALAVSNPKAYLAIAAVYSKAMVVASNPLADAILKCVILSLAIIVIHTLWALAGSALTATLRDPRASRLVNLSMAAALVVVLLTDIL